LRKATTVCYMVHDLNDAAVTKRISMLKVAGCRVKVFGFYRGEHKPTAIDGATDVVAFARSYDARLHQRALLVFWAVWKLFFVFRNSDQDVVIARNLESLFAVTLAVFFARAKNSVVYECLDIHWLLLSKRLPGKIIKLLERCAVRSSKLIITSSPGFIENYFALYHPHRPPILLLENKVFAPAYQFLTADKAASKKVYADSGICHNLQTSSGDSAEPRPWTIGWFGAIRCEKSLHILAEATSTMAGKIRVVIRGKPSLAAIPEFYEIVENEPYIEFKGAYAYPDDLSKIYHEVDFNWTLDFYEEGANSEWLLPNRIYEGSLFDCIPIYREHNQVSAYCKHLNIGVALQSNYVQELVSFFTELDNPRFAALKQVSESIDKRSFICDDSECLALRELISNIAEYTETSVSQIFEITSGEVIAVEFA